MKFEIVSFRDEKPFEKLFVLKPLNKKSRFSRLWTCIHFKNFRAGGRYSTGSAFEQDSEEAQKTFDQVLLQYSNQKGKKKVIVDLN